MRARTLLVALGLLGMLPGAAPAALLRYDMRPVLLLQFSETSPNVEVLGGDVGDPPTDVALVDESGPDPVLRKLLFVDPGGGATTIDVPVLAGFIVITASGKEGPTGEFTGTGSTASSIAWGVVSGWTITGGTWCNAQPSFICDISGRIHLATVNNVLESTFYDIGTWVFHGTGFTAAGFINLTQTLAGNRQFYLKGTLGSTGTVPALPVLGLGALGASLFAMGLTALRRKKKT